MMTYAANGIQIQLHNDTTLLMCVNSPEDKQVCEKELWIIPMLNSFLLKDVADRVESRGFSRSVSDNVDLSSRFAYSVALAFGRNASSRRRARLRRPLGLYDNCFFSKFIFSTFSKNACSATVSRTFDYEQRKSASEDPRGQLRLVLQGLPSAQGRYEGRGSLELRRYYMVSRASYKILLNS